MITIEEYIELCKKHPFYTNEPYEGIEEDKTKIIEYNKHLIELYPWLLPRYVFTDTVDPDYDYSYTELDNLHIGWYSAFGLQMCEEIQKALEKTNYVNEYRILEIKEKFGGLRWYTNGAPQEVDDIVSKYEDLSYNICIICGKPAEYESTGWICPFCSDCAHREFDRDEKFYRENYKDYKPGKFEDRYKQLNKE